MTQKIYVLTGKRGDILSFLPVLYAEYKAGQRCALLLSSEFASLMDGVGYADKIEFASEPWEIDKAMAQAWQLSSQVRCVQVAGPPDLVKQHSYAPNGQEFAVTDSFVKEQWKLAGHLPLWKTQPSLLFDRRDKEREAKLLEKFPKKKKVILVSAGGLTAPFPHKELLIKILELNFQPKFVVVDLERFKAERIYDLLTLFEKAHCLVACDSAPLHLAQACLNLPVVALANDSPSLWHGAPWRANHICYIRYKDFPNRAVEMLDAIEAIGQFGSMQAVPAKTRRCIHIWSQYDLSPDNLERHKTACWEWQKVYSEAGNWISGKIDLRAIGKDSKTVLKDERPFPGLKEVVRLGAFRAKENDVLVLTRADTCFGNVTLPELPCYARRTLRDEHDTWHPIPDFFAFTKAWWLEHEKELPDLIMGMDHWWPRCLMELIKKHGGTELPSGMAYRAKSEKPSPFVERQYVAHNEKLAKAWLTEHGGLAMFPAVSEQLQTIRINPRALFAYGYNPSVIRYDGKILMAYRYHPDRNLSTRLAMAELDEHFNVVRNSEITISGPSRQSSEDARLFTFRGQLWISWVDADWPSKVPTSVVKYGRLVQVGSAWNIEDVIQPMKQGVNRGMDVQKNWNFWEREDSVCWIYKIFNGCQIVEDGGEEHWHSSPAPHWPWGEIRGGSTPLPYQGKLLRFFHSSLDFELPPNHRRYFLGAALMEPEPPFATVAVSNKPIVWGSELDDLSETERSQCMAHKPKVVFPAGAITHEDGWLVSAGINDAECVLIKIKEGNLNL